MPNGGNNQSYFDDLNRFFRPIAKDLQSFAVAHNLDLERYYHEFPIWSLRFAHPQGGSAKIEVMKSGETTVSVSGIWWLDVYSEFTRYSRDTERLESEVHPEHVLANVRRVAAEVLGWRRENWTHVTRDHEEVWGTLTESQFSQMANRFPTPRFP